MIELQAIRWGEPYESLDVDEVKHFYTGEPVAKMHCVGSGIVQRDAKKAKFARRALQDMSPAELIEKCKHAGELFENGTLTVGDSQQTPEDFIQQQSATTGMPVSMCRANVTKNAFVLKNIDTILDALTRGLDLNILARGYGEEGRGVTLSYQAQCDALGAVLPSNSPGVHTLWIPVIALQIGLVLKPGSSEPWTPYRVYSAMVEAGIPRETFCLYPGAGADIGGAILSSCRRSMIFGGPQTIQQYSGNPKVQVHGPGYSKILLGDDCVDNWEQYIDMMADSVYRNGGRSCLNASSIYASRHTKEIAEALAAKLGPIEVLPPDDPNAGLAAFTIEGAAKAIWGAIENDAQAPLVTDMTSKYGDRLVERDPVAYLRPVVLHHASIESDSRNKEYMFPMVNVVECPEAKMLDAIDYSLICTGVTNNESLRRDLLDSTNIDRLNLGPIPTPQVDWLQPHEGNLIEFLYKNRAVQVAN
ncbi:aldehyde dehydrogenase family protein [Aeoliella mucimassa]|uniref:2-aminomuconic 6-semialdehyde dehydrogenase n=1 Tax=Aeoliella mucimassa TaxID=2527972 RepID=A0A518AV30_9BACT|nr:aldehyde dehydrogenase family protein [Aeoliella mucimassa]QDU58573.1 2-aminomuconic 6-semialdehyde dehydrogenase [Aeoliella mucimassa]